MRMKLFFPIRLFLSVAFSFLSCTAVLSQVPVPTEWSSFVQGGENPLVQDTFLLQTFCGDPGDVWKYTKTGTCGTFKLGDFGRFEDSSMQTGFRLFGGSRITFADNPYYTYNESYRNIKTTFTYGMLDVRTEEKLFLSYNTKNEKVVDKCIVAPVTKENCACSFTLPKKYSIQSDSPVFTIEGMLNGLSLSVGKASTTENLFYALDSVYSYGEIPAYSLFTGSGLWSDNERWSHLPVERRREALVKGDVTVDTPISCRSLHLHDSQLRFAESGSLQIEDALFVYYTFPQKGEWYFISFPFDVYLTDMDVDVELKDDTFSGGGNYFYLCRYNGLQRAEQQAASGNWEVISPSALSSSKPLFEKNKGYLIALDEEADKQTLRFGVKGKKLPADFGRKGTIPVKVASSVSASDDGDYGWQLCGNPFPFELQLSDISSNPDLDGNIYLYEKAGYKAYPIGGPYTIPPYSAFFVKASKDTELMINAGEPKLMFKSLSPSSLSRFAISEPLAMQQTVGISLGNNSSLHCRLGESILSVYNMPVRGNVYIHDLSGRLVRTVEIPAGNSSTLLSLSCGTYAVTIMTKDTAGKEQRVFTDKQYVR